MDTLKMNSFKGFFTKLWQRFSSLSRRTQIISLILLVVLIAVVTVLLRGKSTNAADNTNPTVTLESVSGFGASGDTVNVLGTVQSVNEANLLAQAAGTVVSVNTTLGASVPAGFVLANLSDSAQSAQVLQAQGAYDAAVAEESATSIQSENSATSVSVETTSIQNAYVSAYTTTESVLGTDISQLFGADTPVGPGLLINPLTTNDTFPRERRSIDVLMATWQESLASVNTTDPVALLSAEQANLTTVSTFITNLSSLASTQGSAATPEQLAALATAQGTINGLISGVTASQTAYNASVTAAAVGQTQSNSGGDSSTVTSSEAGVEEALGALRAAQAAYENTVIRAPIAGTVNYLPIHVGDYVTANQHVATVARNNALEVVMYLSQDDRNRLAVGDMLTIDGSYQGVVTTIAPALDPTTKQIEVDVAIDDTAALVDGESVQVALPTPTPSSVSTESATASSTAATSTSSVYIPITAVKLLPSERDVFTVSAGRLVAHPVEIGNVIGDTIQILTPLDPSLEIVTDARGLSAGDAVEVSTSTDATVAGASDTGS